jgi:5-methylcytosine-specific restriction endonuclease McrA
MPKKTKTIDRGSRDWYQLECWRKTRRWQLQQEPLCRVCAKEGRVSAAVVADHIVPCKDDWVAFRLGALQSLCADCHDRKSKAERGYRAKLWFDINGDPLPVPDWHKDAEDEDEDDD